MRQSTVTSLAARRLRGVVRSAVLWGAGWFVAGLVAIAGLRAVGEVSSTIGMLDAVGMSIRVGVWGGIVGTLFSGLVGVVFRGRRLRELRPWQFALAGAVVGGAGIPLLLQTFNVLSGDGPVAWHLVSDDAVLGTVLGAALAGGSLWLAQRGGGPDAPTSDDRAPDVPGAPSRATIGQPMPAHAPGASPASWAPAAAREREDAR